ncbi:10678_t:CDS:2, partial [Paraglomus brasilianum]
MLSVSNAPHSGTTYFSRPLEQWSLLSFLKRKRPAMVAQELDYNNEHTFYENTIKQVFDDTKRQKLLVDFEAEKMSEGVAKFWLVLGWCQQYGGNNQALIPPKTRGFFDEILRQKSYNYDLLQKGAM